MRATHEIPNSGACLRADCILDRRFTLDLRDEAVVQVCIALEKFGLVVREGGIAFPKGRLRVGVCVGVGFVVSFVVGFRIDFGIDFVVGFEFEKGGRMVDAGVGIVVGADVEV